MKKYVLVIIGLLIAISHVQGQFLKTKGKAIIDERGDTILLRGMGLGGWMLQEGYMFRVSNLGQQYRIREKIKDVVGEEKTSQFYERWLSNHTSKQDIDSLAAWGFNSIRLPMHYNLYTLPVEDEPVKGQHTWLDKGFALTDSLLSWCRANHIYLFLDLHAAPGGQGNDLPISDRNPAKPSLWESEANRDKTIALWKKLAARYVNEPWMGGYDIINEPNWGFEDPKNDFRGTSEKKNEPLKKLMIDITKAIREVDNKHIIIIEGNGFGNNYRGILPPWDDNMVLSFHKYGNFNNPNSIKGFLELRDTYNLPLWLGESGENSNTWFTEAIALVETEGIGWAWWQHKKMGINNPLEIKRPAGYDRLLAYWADKAPKPPADSAWAILATLLENVKCSNNIIHYDVVDAMIRQVNATSSKPYRQLVIGDKQTINAVDFDMGRQRYVYFDRDSARYQYTPGINTDGNKGHQYRNDGVDIQRDGDSYYVNSIEDGEWTQYSFYNDVAGDYQVSLKLAAEKEGGRVTLQYNNKNIIDNQAVKATGGPQQWQSGPVVDVYLAKGYHLFRFVAVSGGFSFAGIQFEKKK